MLASPWQRLCEKKVGLHTTQIKPHIPWQNSAEQGVGVLKRGGARLVRNTDAPPVLWEWELDYEAEVKSCTVSTIPRIWEIILHEHMTGETSYITKLVQLRWYGLVYYWSHNSFPDSK